MTDMKSKAEKPCCGNCIYWFAGEGNDGLCRRHPPQVCMDHTPAALVEQAPIPRFMAQFPPIKSHGWCGEHEESEQEFKQ